MLHVQVSHNVDTEEFKTADLLHLRLMDCQRLMKSPLLPHVHCHLLGLICVEREAAVDTACHQTCHLSPVCCFVTSSDQTNEW